MELGVWFDGGAEELDRLKPFGLLGRAVETLDFRRTAPGPAFATPSHGSVSEDPAPQSYHSVFPARSRPLRERPGDRHMVPYGPWPESKFLCNSTTICSRS